MGWLIGIILLGAAVLVYGTMGLIALFGTISGRHGDIVAGVIIFGAVVVAVGLIGYVGYWMF